MTPELLRDSKVAVYGLAKSGLAAIRLLVQRGARVTALDARSPEALGAVARELEAQGVTLVTGPVPPGLLESQRLVVVSPGVPLALAELRAAYAAGVPLWGEVELAGRLLAHVPLFGITGTNGKSTTTALTGELFAQGGGRTFVGGNLGRPFAEAALEPGAWDALVVELSSFQLEGIEALRPRGAAVLNLTPDHIDRYADHAAYGAAKARIWKNQTAEDFAVVNADDADVMRLALLAPGRVYGFSLTGTPVAPVPRLTGLAVARPGGFAFEGVGEPGETFTLTNRALRGGHNTQNAMAAALLARLGNANAAGEYYLTDVVELSGKAAVIEAAADEVAGVNSRAELAAVEATWQQGVALEAADDSAGAAAASRPRADRCEMVRHSASRCCRSSSMAFLPWIMFLSST